MMLMEYVDGDDFDTYLRKYCWKELEVNSPFLFQSGVVFLVGGWSLMRRVAMLPERKMIKKTYSINLGKKI
ncbi:hypothetical protein J6TS1_11770 [Siminovitchia terrae]|nr:hypothetical protein J22TS1_02920 [Siminovitchia terrae]GIN95307.1 hypothetical protein J6TS1_11770 [Siminovitchia terrae]